MVEQQMKRLEQLIRGGSAFFTADNSLAFTTRKSFEAWDWQVSEWLRSEFKDEAAALLGEWSAFPFPQKAPLDSNDQSIQAVEYLGEVRRCVGPRLEWLGKLAVKMSQSVSASAANRSVGNRVFVVHGHDDATRDKVARFLERLDLVPIILNELPNQGRTVIEKLVEYSDVRYAVVLATGDDIGGEAGTPRNDLKKRARQNVIMELGFFLGHLGRGHVGLLYESGVEIPSNYEGVLYESLEGNWSLDLGREMRAAGLPVDLNKLA